MEKGRVGIVVVGVVSHERICQVRGNRTKADADRSDPQTVPESRASEGSPHIYLDPKSFLNGFYAFPCAQITGPVDKDAR